MKNYEELSREFQGVGEMFLDFLRKREEKVAFDEWVDTNKKSQIKEYLKKQCSFLKRFLESTEGWQLLKQIHLEISQLSKRCSWFCDENLERLDKYDNPKIANNLTERNIREIRNILEIHESNKKKKAYDGMVELRNIQKTLDLCIQVAKQLNYYLKKQNEKPVQLKYGKLMLIYLNEKLNIDYVI
jgi:hypothetical protein